LFLPRGRTLPLPLLNLIRFLSAQFSSLSRSRWMAAQPAGVSTTPPSLVSSANWLRVHSNSSSRSLMKKLNKTGPSTGASWVLLRVLEYELTRQPGGVSGAFFPTFFPSQAVINFIRCSNARSFSSRKRVNKGKRLPFLANTLTEADAVVRRQLNYPRRQGAGYQRGVFLIKTTADCSIKPKHAFTRVIRLTGWKDCRLGTVCSGFNG